MRTDSERDPAPLRTDREPRVSSPARWWLFASLTLMLTFFHWYSIDSPRVLDQMELHRQIVEHRAPAPYQQRILQPLLVDALIRVSPLPEKRTFLMGYLGLRFAGLLIALWACWTFARRFVRGEAALAATILLAAVVPFTFQHYYYQPSSMLELAAFALGFVWIAERRWIALSVLTAVATLNRETAVFLGAYYLLYHFRGSVRARRWAESAAIFAAWLVPFVLIRWAWPAEESAGTIERYVRYNLTSRSALIEAFLAVAPFLALALWGASRKPAQLVRCLTLVPVWVGLCFVFSQLDETRYYLPMLLPELPLAMMTLMPGCARTIPDEASDVRH